MNFTKNFKNVLIISDSFVPEKISAAGMIYNLSKEIVGRDIRVICAFSGHDKQKIKKKYDLNGIKIIQTCFLSGFRNKSLVFRFIFEISISIILAVKCYFYFKNRIKPDLIIWYGPSVFLWIVVKVINFSNQIPVYYILRDIFPDWLISLGIIKNFIVIATLKVISYPQFLVSNVIGVETVENVDYLKNKIKNKKIELLPNWPNIVLARSYKVDDYIKNNFTSLSGNYKQHQLLKLIYIGNNSLAHDFNSIIDFLNNFEEFDKLIINTFSKPSKLKTITNKSVIQKNWGLVSDYNFPFIFSKMDCGIVSLNRHATTSNIPGKFISYVQFGLPIICFANFKSPLSRLILQYECGIVIDLSENKNINKKKLYTFIKDFKKFKKLLSMNSRKLFIEHFDTKSITNKILGNNYD